MARHGRIQDGSIQGGRAPEQYSRASVPANRSAVAWRTWLVHGDTWLACPLLPGDHEMSDGKESGMQNDEPTLPPHLGSPPDAATDPGAFAEAPTWPPAGERSPRPLAPDHSPLLWLSLGATAAVLIGLVGLLVLNLLGVFALRGAPGASGPTSALGSPTATPSPTATASSLALSGWLQVTPSSVRLRCDGDQRTQVVGLANTGPQTVQWQAVVDVSADQAGIAIAPNQGALDAGATVSVQLENRTQSSSSEGGGHSDGVIRFVPSTATAGSPSSLSYRLDTCS